MIPKQYRLKIDAQRPFVGKKQTGQWAVVITRDTPPLQWAIRVSKKVAAKAVIRNRLRRQINFWLFNENAHLCQQTFLIILRQRPRTPQELQALYAELRHVLFT